MPSSKEYHDFVIDSIGLAADIASRKMMGEYLFYYKGGLFGGIYDNRFLIKNLPSVRKLMPSAPEELPYPGAKLMLLVENLDDKKFLADLLRATCASLSAKPIK